MKPSIYNSSIPIDNKHTLLFNSLTRKFISIRDKILDFKSTTPAKLSRDFPRLYNQMIEGGMIVDDNLNEAKLLQQRVNQNDNNSDEFILHINPTLDCNFHCWYCYEKHIHHSKMSNEVLNAIKKLVSTITSKPEIKTIELGFFGGEPLFYFNDIAREIISHTAQFCEKNKKHFHTHFTSNGALLNEKIIGFLSNFPCGFQITLDGGKEEHNKTRFNKFGDNSFELIIRNILSLADAGIHVIVRVNYTSDNITSVPSIMEYFRLTPAENRKFIKFDFQRVWQNRVDPIDMTERIIRQIRQNFRNEGFTVLANYLPHDAFDSCYGDKLNYILINYNGDAFGCTARDFSKRNRIGYIDSTGIVQYNDELINRRNNSKLSKPICSVCRIAPLCGGGCKQKAIENEAYEGCCLNYSEADKDRIILDIFSHSFNI